jgi:hypothetical protein
MVPHAIVSALGISNVCTTTFSTSAKALALVSRAPLPAGLARLRLPLLVLAVARAAQPQALDRMRCLTLPSSGPSKAGRSTLVLYFPLRAACLCGPLKSNVRRRNCKALSLRLPVLRRSVHRWQFASAASSYTRWQTEPVHLLCGAPKVPVHATVFKQAVQALAAARSRVFSNLCTRFGEQQQ